MSEPQRQTVALPTSKSQVFQQNAAQGLATSPRAEEGEDITYIPGPEDPPVAKWRGFEFKANVPKRIKHLDMIESARTNRFFRVGADTGAVNVNFPASTAMQYRAHALSWMKDVDSVEGLVSKWAGDRVLRQTCEVGYDDIAYLGTLIEPKLRAMRLKEGKSEMDVARVWISHGINELPWRS